MEVFIWVSLTSLSKLLSLISAPWTAAQHSGRNSQLFCFADFNKRQAEKVVRLFWATLAMQEVYNLLLISPKILHWEFTHID